MTEPETKEVEQTLDAIAGEAEPNLFEAEDAWLTENDLDAPAEVEPEPEAETPEPEPEKAEEPETPTYTEEQNEEYESALAAMRLAGWEDVDLDGMDRERLIALGKKAAKRNAKLDESLREKSTQVKDLETRLAELSEKLESTAGSEPTSAEPTELAELISELDDVQDGLGGKLGKVLTGILERTATDKQSEDSAGVRDTDLSMAAELSRQRLWERFPELRKPETWESVRAKLDAFNLEAYVSEGSTIHSVFDSAIGDAARVLGLNDAEVAARDQEAEKTDRARTNGQVETTTRTTTPKAMTLEEQEDAILKELEKPDGKTWEQLKRQYGT